MPILPAEPTLCPDDLFTEANTAATSGREWWVLHVRPRQEKSLARELRERETPFYLPLIRHRSLVRGRVCHSHIPLFSGYLFLLADRDEWVEALSTQRVVHPLPVRNQRELWNDLRQVQQLLATGAPVSPETRLLPGTPVEITNGPLAGLRGVVERTASGNRLWVQVNFLQRGASVLLDDCVLTRLPETERPRPAGRN